MKLQELEERHHDLAISLLKYGYIQPNDCIKVVYPKKTLEKIRMDLAIARRTSQEVLDQDNKLQCIEMYTLSGVRWIFTEDN